MVLFRILLKRCASIKTFENVTTRAFQNWHPMFAGHSKWANIKHIKSMKDGQKAELFEKISRQIRVAIQEGGGPDPAINSQLRNVVESALKKNMPMSTIENNIKKYDKKKALLKRFLLEIRFQSKVYVVCTIYTDNFPGLKMNISAMIKKSGGSFVDVSHMFTEFGLLVTRYDSTDLVDLEDRATEDAIVCGAEEIEVVNDKTGAVNFICRPEDLNIVRKYLAEKGYLIEYEEHVYSPKNIVQLSESEQVDYETFLEKLRKVPGLEDIYDNVDVPSKTN